MSWNARERRKVQPLMQTNTSRVEGVIAGGGFAALEAAFSLRQRVGDRARIQVVSDTDEFLFRPNMIYVPFGQEPEDLTFEIGRPLQRQGIEWTRGRVADVDPDARALMLEDGSALHYDYGLLATGARMMPDAIPGFAEHAHTIWTPDENLALRAALEKTVENAANGISQRILFAVPPGNMCSGPLYEIVLMLDTWLRDKADVVRENVDLSFATFEPSYLMVFGPRLDAVVDSEFHERGITGYRERVLQRVDDGQVVFEDASTLPYELLIGFPPYAPAVTYSALPRDDNGFVETELASRRVKGQERLFAIGDAGDFPVKQAFLALLEADAAADAIAAELLGEEVEAGFDPVSLCIMEQFDKATFANVPLQLTGQAVPPVEVRDGAGDDYQVGTGPVWRAGKKMLGMAVPMHFRAGRPFHAGLTWKLMEPGLDTMRALFAD